jgi:hypothetical protein
MWSLVQLSALSILPALLLNRLHMPTPFLIHRLLCVHSDLFTHRAQQIVAFAGGSFWIFEPFGVPVRHMLPGMGNSGHENSMLLKTDAQRAAPSRRDAARYRVRIASCSNRAIPLTDSSTD